MLKHLFRKLTNSGRQTARSDSGVVLITALLFLSLFTVLAMSLIYSITSTVKTSGLLKLESKRFYGSEGGVIAVAAYMAVYRRTDAPEDITNTDNYTSSVKYLGDTIRHPVGYSTLWRGADVHIDSVSPPAPNGKSEIESVVFIPVAPAGYGNE